MSQQPVERELTIHEIGFLDLDTPERPQVISGVAILGRAGDEQVHPRPSNDASSSTGPGPTAESNRAEQTSPDCGLGSGPSLLSCLRTGAQRLVNQSPQFRCRISRAFESTHRQRTERTWIVAENFRLEDHILEIALDTASSDDVLTFVAQQAALGLDPHLPPWRIGLIRFQDANDKPRWAVAIWAHHSLMDGLEGMKMFSSLVDVPEGKKVSQRSDNASRFKPARPLRPMSAACVRAAAADLGRRAKSTPLSGDGSKTRQTVAVAWPRGAFREARRRHAASLQEVLLMTLSQGFADYCAGHGYRGSVRAILPLGRSTAPEQLSFTSNRHDAGYIHLPAAGCDASRRLKTIRRGLQRLKRELADNVFPTVMRFSGLLPMRVRQLIANRWSTRANLVISLLAEPNGNPTIGGATVDAIYAQPAVSIGHGAAIGIILGRDQIRMTIQVDPAVVRRPETLVESIQNAYSHVVLGQPAPSHRRTAANPFVSSQAVLG